MERISLEMNNTGMKEDMPMPMPMPMPMTTHMTFFWGKSSEILFSGWPGESLINYILALVFIFLLSMLIEWLSHARIIKPGMLNKVVAGSIQAFMYALRIGLAYLVMLAVMSFNVGVLLAAVAGYTTGFLLFGSQAAFKEFKQNTQIKESDLPPLNC